MRRYVVERSFADGVGMSAAVSSAETCRATLEANARADVTWIHSYVSGDGRKSFCLYEAPTPEAVRRASTLNRLPVDSITEVRTLDPYSFGSPPPKSALAGAKQAI
ncbi:MAG TPA: DUF4242 domain-containing protein [Candidatus Micrarchaeaceae archaeon]|nr:DUF4242 domain-containing protein [Candidatus Micrarchaeaceae archaeon]